MPKIFLSIIWKVLVYFEQNRIGIVRELKSLKVKAVVNYFTITIWYRITQVYRNKNSEQIRVQHSSILSTHALSENKTCKGNAFTNVG